jgi:hypothetical protein
MKTLNKESYRVEPNSLIYDFYRIIDAKNVEVTLSGDSAGTLKRGQVLDFTDGKYVVHADDGTANCLVTDDVEYAQGDTEAVVSVYISGNFRRDKVVAETELTEKDLDNLRMHGIVLK